MTSWEILWIAMLLFKSCSENWIMYLMCELQLSCRKWEILAFICGKLILNHWAWFREVHRYFFIDKVSFDLSTALMSCWKLQVKVILLNILSTSSLSPAVFLISMDGGAWLCPAWQLPDCVSALMLLQFWPCQALTSSVPFRSCQVWSHQWGSAFLRPWHYTGKHWLHSSE